MKTLHYTRKKWNAKTISKINNVSNKNIARTRSMVECNYLIANRQQRKQVVYGASDKGLSSLLRTFFKKDSGALYYRFFTENIWTVLKSSKKLSVENNTKNVSTIDYK